MKLCFLGSLGATGHTDRWIRYFANAGHEVHLITSKPSNGEIKDLKLHLRKRFGPRIPIVNQLVNIIPTVTQLKTMIRNIGPDIIHAHAVEIDAFLGALSGFHPFVVTPWGSDVLVAPQKSIASRWMAKYVLKKADLITSDAEHIREPLVKLGAAPQKIRLVCFGVDTGKFKPGPKDEQLKKRLGIFDSPTVITSRRLDPDCDVATLFMAIPLVLKDVPEAKFVIIGQGSEEMELRELARSIGVDQSVRLLGWVSHDELPRYLTSADVYVSTALSDAGLAASTAEAMSCGLPVIITNFGDNRKWVEDGVNGFIIPLKAPQVLGSKITYFLKHEEVGREFGRLSREIIEQRNNWEKEMEKMGKLYKELTEQWKR